MLTYNEKQVLVYQLKNNEALESKKNEILAKAETMAKFSKLDFGHDQMNNEEKGIFQVAMYDLYRAKILVKHSGEGIMPYFSLA